MARPTKNSTSRRWWVGNLILRACRVVLGVGKPCDWSVIREGPLQKIDQAIDLGRQHGIHITLNFHRIPGYCINGCELELADLFTGTKAQRDKALDAGVYQWKAFARRYKGIPNRHLSFDLINEPPKMWAKWGVFNKTPHAVALAWMEDSRAVEEAGWGFSLWELRGSFGVMDSERADVTIRRLQGR
jgi:hypothetical protein